MTTVIAKRTRVGGPIETDGDVVVEGRVEGAIRAGGCVTVGVSGVALSDLVVGRAVVLGIVIGDIAASDRVDVGAGARVVGDVRAPVVAVIPPGAIEGQVAQEEAPRARPTLRIRGRGPLVRPVRPDGTAGQRSRAPTAPLPAVPPRPAPPPTETLAPVAATAPEVPEPPRPLGRLRMAPRRPPGEP